MKIHLWNREGVYYWLDCDHIGVGDYAGANIAAGPFETMWDALLNADDTAGAGQALVVSLDEPEGADYLTEGE